MNKFQLSEQEELIQEFMQNFSVPILIVIRLIFIQTKI